MKQVATSFDLGAEGQQKGYVSPLFFRLKPHQHTSRLSSIVRKASYDDFRLPAI